MPDTGVTRTYDFTLSYDNISPDGVQKLGLLINGQYPGPTIEANWGDWIEVTVHNQLTNEGTALHWHGLLQKETQWMDGVPGVAQCPIPPGQSFTYRFRADLFGTSWYHSHYSAQYVGGSVGPMVIYGPRTEDYDIDLGPIMLNDWYHSAYYPLVEQTMAPASENQPIVQSDNILISGHGTFDCSKTTLPCVPNAGLAKFQFQSGKTHRLRLMNTGAESILKFSIDEHTMTVIANDYVPLNPYNTTAVTLGVGQRTDVLVTADLDSTSAVFMRANAGPGLAAGGCNSNNPEASQAMAVIYYEDANTTVIPTSSPQSDAELTYCGNDDLSLTTPLQELAPVTDAATTQEVHISYRSNGTHNLFYMGEETYRADYNDAILLSANQGDLQFPAQSNVYDFGSNATVNLVVYNHFPAEHPMHMHGHNYWVLAEGTGRWNGRITNPHNPQRRDVQILQPGSQHGPPSYIVVQITQDNPGIWPFHCHIAWHVSGGLYMNLLERKEDITGLKIPGQMAQTCSDWADYTNSMAPDQIDSGL
ncbi:multicopper oxidase [Saccharata proteae CBS 121410]|uniref:Multicopper oxidase n=1 Tax=Saccharata proteae CBS 121410 TaxID=1314787 RepID=A0A9P4HR91_9PEZI|nr:multicopper oxidase [Saccharata proteae CBS 121410]